MLETGLRRLPVVGPTGALVGMVSMRDLFALETLV
jgi:CBS domain-containing protein